MVRTRALNMATENLAQKLHACALLDLEDRARAGRYEKRIGKARLRREVEAAAAKADEFHKVLIDKLMKEIF